MNGHHFLHYPYRLPLSRVDTLGIFGDILVKAVGFLNINVSSSGAKAWVAAVFNVLWHLDRPGAPSPAPDQEADKGEGIHRGVRCKGREEKVTTERGPKSAWVWGPVNTEEQWPGNE